MEIAELGPRKIYIDLTSDRKFDTMRYELSSEKWRLEKEQKLLEEYLEYKKECINFSEYQEIIAKLDEIKSTLKFYDNELADIRSGELII